MLLGHKAYVEGRLGKSRYCATFAPGDGERDYTTLPPDVLTSVVPSGSMQWCPEANSPDRTMPEMRPEWYSA